MFNLSRDCFKSSSLNVYTPISMVLVRLCRRRRMQCCQSPNRIVPIIRPLRHSSRHDRVMHRSEVCFLFPERFFNHSDLRSNCPSKGHLRAKFVNYLLERQLHWDQVGVWHWISTVSKSPSCPVDNFWNRTGLRSTQSTKSFWRRMWTPKIKMSCRGFQVQQSFQF